MSFRKIVLPNRVEQWCLLTGTTTDIKKVMTANLSALVAKSTSSDLFVDSDTNVFLKAPRIKSFFRNNLAKLSMLTPACKELRGNRILRKLGLKVSLPLVRAIPINPFNPYRSMLYCLYLPHAQPLNEFLESYPEALERKDILDTVAGQMAIMIRAGVVFRDFYFGNILYSPNEGLFWIDTEVKQYVFCKGKARRRFLKRKELMYERFLRHGGLQVEWGRFSRILFD